MAQAPPILIYEPGGGVSSPIGSNPPVYSQAGTTALIEDQGYIDVVFGSIQTDDEWVLAGCIVVNELDVDPLNIWPGIITDKTTAGFRVYLNGLPDSGNYYLHWSVSGINIEPSLATTYYLTGPATGPPGEAATFTVTLPPSTYVNSAVIVTPSEGGLEIGVFSPEFVTLTTASPSKTFTFTPALYGATTITVNNDRGLTDPADLTFTAVVDSYELSGPSSGYTGDASTDFTVELPVGGVVVGTVTVTPDDDGDGGTFTPTTVELTTAAPSDTFTYTSVSDGNKTISVTNDGGLTDPDSLSYTSDTPLVGYGRSLTVDHTKVSSTQTDFPVLVSITNATLKTVANGGHVENSNGYDIGFFSDLAGTTPLKWELEKYVPTTGEVVAWVKIASLSSSVDTVFYMRYGDSSIITDQSDPVNVWTNGYISVYHLGNNGVTLSVADAKAANNGTNVNGCGISSGGMVDGAADFIASSSQYVNLGHSSGFDVGSDYTFSTWFYHSGAYLASPASRWLVCKDTNTGRSFALGVTSILPATPVISFQIAGAVAVSGGTTLTGSTAYYLTLTKNGGTTTIYLNGASDASAASATIPNTSTDVTIGARLYPAFQEYWQGWIDEAHFCSVGRSAGWVLTEYNNQNAPGTFITVGTET